MFFEQDDDKDKSDKPNESEKSDKSRDSSPAAPAVATTATAKRKTGRPKSSPKSGPTAKKKPAPNTHSYTTIVSLNEKFAWIFFYIFFVYFLFRISISVFLFF